MNRSPQVLKRLLSPEQLKAFTFSLYNTSSSLLSLLLSPLPYLRRLLSKTLSFLSSSMEPFLFSSLSSPSPYWDDDFSAFDPSPQSPSAEPLFLVSFRWWSEANAAIYGGREIRGVLYDATSCLRNKKLEKDNFLSEVESEILLEMRTAGQTGAAEEEGISGRGNSDLCLALISEWMFLRAFKWHNDRKDVGGFLTEGLEDLFSLQIRLSFIIKENSFYIRINQKENEIRAFQRACDIFCVESGLLQIWDFSGQTSQFLINERKLFSVSDQPGEDILLKLEVYGLSFIEAREMKKDGLMVEQLKNGVPSCSNSLKMNGNADDANSYCRKQSSLLDGGCGNACSLGLTGLFNLGNTCFMNSALQCLVHTTELVDYFLSDFHKDLNFENPLGMHGNLARAFGELLRKLWTPGATPVAPREFKSVISGFAPQFSGYNQHDSQEFLSFLLDGLHEDLNRVKSKPYIEVKDGDCRPDEEVADEHWRNHLARNDSIIVDLFQGQYRSRVVCPVCKKMSITFDPFMYLSLPLPSTTTRTMTLTVLSTDGTALPFPVTITVPKFGNLKDLVQALSVACSLGDDETLLVAEVYDNKVLRFLDDPFDTLELIRDDDRLVAYRLPKDSESSPLVVFTHQEKSVISGLSSRKKFGIPLVSRMSNFSDETEMRKEFLKLLHPFLMPVEDSSNDGDDMHNIDNEDLGVEDEILDQEENVNIRFKSDSTNTSKDFDIHMDEAVPIPKSSNAVNVFVVSWPEKMLEDYDTVLLNSLPEVYKPAFLLKKPQDYVSLYNCLDAFLKEEPLGPDDMWYCPSCKSHQQASKKLDLWRLPEILVIHLKRFSYNRFFKNKLESFVDFPIDYFDLSNYMVHKDRSISHHYMLYAVSNHYGGMGYGHYTAFVQHRGRWYDFDDSNVYQVSDEQIKTSSAYVLFYRRISDPV